MTSHSQPPPLELTIDAIDSSGCGIGTLPDKKNKNSNTPPCTAAVDSKPPATRSDNDDLEQQVAVPFTVPGDYVRITTHGKRNHRWKGSLVEVLKPGPSRIKARCGHFGICGGCTLQQMSYPAQLKYKDEYVRRLFAKFITQGTQIYPAVPTEREWGYRNKMEYTFSNNRAGDRFLGLVMHGSKRKILNLTECHLASPWFIDALKTVRQWWDKVPLRAYHLSTQEGTLRTLVLREGQSSGDRLVMLTVSGNPEYAPSRTQLDKLVAALRTAIDPKNQNQKGKLSIFLRIQQTNVGMATNFYEMLLYGPDYIHEELSIEVHADRPPHRVRFQFSPTAFFQPHPQQAAITYSLALKMADLKTTDRVYDLYCGIGTLGICASPFVKEVIGIEISPEMALDARLNAKLNDAANVTIYAGAVRHILNKLGQDQQTSPDVVFIDPPRTGIDPIAMRHVLELRAPRLVYISCNPSTQVENIDHLIQGGYRLVSLQPVDHLAQTMHMKNIALLVYTKA